MKCTVPEAACLSWSWNVKCSSICWTRWYGDAKRVTDANSLDFPKVLSHSSKSSSPTPSVYMGCQSSWQPRLWAWPWNDGTTPWRRKATFLEPRTLWESVFTKAHIISYPRQISAPYLSISRWITASGYFILKMKGDDTATTLRSQKDTHNSPLRIMSQITRTWPCLQTARKIPATAKRANIFLRASGPAFRQRSTQVLTHCVSSLVSVRLSHATSSTSKSVSGSVSSGVSGTGSAEELAGAATGMGVALEGTTPSGALCGVRRSGYKRKVKHK